MLNEGVLEPHFIVGTKLSVRQRGVDVFDIEVLIRGSGYLMAADSVEHSHACGGIEPGRKASYAFCVCDFGDGIKLVDDLRYNSHLYSVLSLELG